MWVSPANYYTNWNYQNEKGEIMSNKICQKLVKETNEIYSSYNILTTKEGILKKTFLGRIPTNFKKVIKKLLSKIFPLIIG